MTATTRIPQSTDSLLRFAMRADAVISGLTGVALLLATHDPLIAEAADRVLTMRDGSEVSGPS